MIIHRQPGFLHSVSNCLRSEIGDVSGREGQRFSPLGRSEVTHMNKKSKSYPQNHGSRMELSCVKCRSESGSTEEGGIISSISEVQQLFVNLG